MNNRIFIVAGDVSGDLHAARLVDALRRLDPGVRVTALGGPALQSAADDFKGNIAELSAFGFLAPARLYFRLRRLFDDHIRKPWTSGDAPDRVVLVDYYGFNIHVAAFARSCGIPVFYYISPQVWASRPGRVKKLAASVDRMLVILPFEERIYRDAGVDAEFVGHPLLETVPGPDYKPSRTGRPLIGLFPGSRKSAWSRHLPILRDAAELIRRERDVDFVTFVPPRAAPPPSPFPTASATDFELRRKLTLALSVSGTVSLENALMGIPMIVFYKLAGINYLLAKRLVRVPYITMANILAGREMVPELIQDRATPANIADEALRLLTDEEALRSFSEGLSAVRARLGSPGASERAARAVLCGADGKDTMKTAKGALR